MWAALPWSPVRSATMTRTLPRATSTTTSGTRSENYIGGEIGSYATEHLPPATSPLDQVLRSALSASGQSSESQSGVVPGSGASASSSESGSLSGSVSASVVEASSTSTASSVAAAANSGEPTEGISNFNASGYRNSALDQLTLADLGSSSSAPTGISIPEPQLSQVNVEIPTPGPIQFPSEAPANPAPGTFAGDLLLSQQTGLTMDQVIALRARRGGPGGETSAGTPEAGARGGQ